MIARFVRALVACALVLPCMAGAQTVEPAAVRFAELTLDNGLRVYAVEDHAAAVVQTAMWYRVGSLDEQPGKTGLAHALEHMMFRGTSQISAGGIDDISARLGAVVNADTNEDYTHFYEVVPADQLDFAIRMEADRMRGLLLRQADWDVERGAVLGEIDSDDSQPAAKLGRDVRAAAYAGSPYALTPLGVRADVVRSGAADLRRIYDRGYAPNNAALVVTGDVKPADVFAAAQRWFGPLARRKIPAERPLPQLATSATANVAETADTPFPIVDLAYRIPGDLDPDAAPTQLLDDVINSERSPFYRALVLSKLVQGYNASADTALHAGIFHVQLIVTPGGDPQEVRRVFERTLGDVRARGVGDAALAAAKIAAAHDAVYARDAISGLGDRYGYALAVEGHDPDDDDRAFAAVDRASIDGALRRYLARPAAVGILRPRSASTNAADRRAAQPPRVHDDFSKRPPTGPIVLAPWAAQAAARPPAVESRVAPVISTLANGLRLYVQVVHENPTVFVRGWTELAPSFDPPGKTGVGRLTSTLLAYGSHEYDFDDQRRLADELGAELGLGASFSAHGLAPDLSRLLDPIADALRFPTFPLRYFDLLKAQARAAVLEEPNDPVARAQRAFDRGLYAPNDPSIRRETAASVDAIAPADVRAYAARYLRPDRTTLVIVGDVDPVAVHDAVAARFGDWENHGPRPDPHLPPLPPTRRSIVVIPAQRGAISVRLGQAAIARSNPDFFAYNLVNAVLGGEGSFDTRLMHELRERRGLVYGVSSSLLVTNERGLLAIDLAAAPPKLAPAVRAAKAEARRITQAAISEGEWDRARTKLLAGATVAEEATATLVARCENIARYRLDPRYYVSLAARYARLTPADGLRVARRYLHPDDWVEVYEGTR